ncbi:class I SAM-dependent methyltransferase [Candidatus Gottesmanbacteria bacterium]|nr:class I SAM-dependent methyltransferase [Candidatus Gottesmanbacteria bacterium]
MNAQLDRIPKAIVTYDKIASLYARKVAPRAPKQELEKFTKYLNPGSKVLDVGCAAGRDTRILKDNGFTTIGIDLSKGLLAIARKENPGIEFFFADVRQLPFPDQTFEGLWSNAVFHQLQKEDMGQALSEWKRVLKKDGILYLRTKMGSGDIKTADELSGGEEREFTLLSEDELKQMLQSAEFKLLESYQSKDETRDLTWINTFSQK